MIRTLTLLSLFVLPLTAAAQGKLDAVREAVDKPHSSDSSKSDTTDDGSCPTPDPGPEGHSPSNDNNPFDTILFMVAGAPWVAPHELWDPGLKVAGQFTPYPFAAPDTGYVLLDRPNAPADGRPRFVERTDADWYSVRASAEFGNDFDGLRRLGLRLFLDTDTRFGLKTDWDYYWERLPCGCRGCRDEMWIGDVTGTFRFVQNEWLMMHTGAGARLLIDHGHDRGGINFLYGFDAFPVRPWHLFGSVEAGTLSAAAVWRVRGGVGANWTHAELFAGYDYLEIGGTALQGPFVGLRLWF